MNYHRKTRADAAREKGLEPLADFLLAQKLSVSVTDKASEFIDREHAVELENCLVLRFYRVLGCS